MADIFIHVAHGKEKGNDSLIARIIVKNPHNEVAIAESIIKETPVMPTESSREPLCAQSKMFGSKLDTRELHETFHPDSDFGFGSNNNF